MYKEQLRLVFRKLSRSRLYTCINIAGLAIALTAALLIYGHIMKETRTDRFHPQKENIYRITTSGVFSDKWGCSTCAPISVYAAQEIAAIKDYTRLSGQSQYFVQTNTSTGFINPGKTLLADASFFNMFNFPLICGDIPKRDKEKWCILSATTAQKLFGNQNPTGLSLQAKKNQFIGTKAEEYQIIGVMADIPAWSSIQTDIVFNYGAVEDPYWNNWGIETYLLLQPHADIQTIEKALPQLYIKNNEHDKDSKLKIQLQSLTDIYFYSGDLESTLLTSYAPQGSLQLTIILCAISLVILLLSTCNYLMIKIAQMSSDFSTMAIQKCYGANNRTLQLQIALEVGTQFFIATLIAGVAAYTLHPWFIGIMSPRQLYPFSLSVSDIAIFIGLILLLTTVISGYLCHYIARHIKQASLKTNIIKFTGKYDPKKVLATVQMSIFCALLFCSVIVIRQMDYIRNKDLGINTKNLLTTFIGQPQDYEVFKAEAKQNPAIESVSIGSALPASWGLTQECLFPEHPDVKITIQMLMGDADYIPTYEIGIVEGENIHKETYLIQQQLDNEYYLRYKEAKGKNLPFTEEEPVHEVEALVNQKFVKEAGLTHPVGTIISAHSRKFRIVGVTKDFHYQSLYTSISPLLISYNGGYNDRSVNVRYREGQLSEAVRHLDNVTKSYPYRTEEFMYQEYNNSGLYYKDLAFIKMINIFTGLALLIGGMGIFAFSVFLAQNKKKEVALRKVNGASEWEVMSLLNRTFILRAVMACFIGIPIAYFAMQKWMENYAYKTTISWWLYLVTITICIIFVIAVISWQTWNAATRNPIESLKSKG